jgi:hypothetical protein
MPRLVRSEEARAEATWVQPSVLSFDGVWSVENGTAPQAIPATFLRTLAGPELTNQARPDFPDLDQHETHEYMYTLKRFGVLPASVN